MLPETENAYEKLEFLFQYVGAAGLKLYILIDGYDNFAIDVQIIHDTRREGERRVRRTFSYVVEKFD